MMPPSCLVNGVAQSQIDAQDRGLAYGDGLFETLRIHRKRPLYWSQHMARLALGCTRLRIPMPRLSLLEEEALRLSHTAPEAVLKIIITRGSAGRGYTPPITPQITRILSVHPLPDYPSVYASEGIHAAICQTRLARQAQLAGMKHLNRLEQVLARAELQSQTPEGLMRDTDDNVISGTMSNLFVIEPQGLLTAPLQHAGIEGITRARILRLCAEQGITVQQNALSLDQVHAAQGLFLCNSLIGIWPIRQLEEKRYKIPALVRQLSHALSTQDSL